MFNKVHARAMAAFGAGLLDDPLAASDWDTDSFFAGADRAAASTDAPQAQHLQSAFDVNARACRRP